MSDVPERIWARPVFNMADEALPYGEWHVVRLQRWDEYIRADLAAQKDAQIADLQRQLAEAQAIIRGKVKAARKQRKNQP